MKCDKCDGFGFVADTMKVHLDGKTIKDCLEMSVSEAYDFFKDKDDVIANILNVLIRVGMGYIKLGQKTPTISGGESQRINLLNELVDMGNTIIVTEHDTSMLSNCDWIIEMGPAGGKNGGYVIAEGSPLELKNNPSSIIGKYLKTK